MDPRDTPKALSAEKSVLGAVLLRNEVAAEVHLSPRDFFDPRHRAIWAAMLELSASDEAIDTTTLETALTNAGKLEAVGGLAYLSEVAIFVPTADNVQHYAAIVRRKRTARETMLGLSEAIGDIRKHELDGPEALERAEHALSALRKYRERQRGFTVADAARSTVREILEGAEAAAQGKVVPRISTGILTLDNRIGGGLGRGSWAVAAARPRNGKTSFISQVCRRAPVPSLLVIYEDWKDFVYRELAAQTGIAAVDLAGYRVKDRHECRALLDAVGAMRPDFHVIDGRGMDGRAVIAEARRYVAEHGVELLAVDYLNRMRHPRADRYDISIRETLDILDDGIGELDIAGLLGAQLGRATEKEKRLPRLSDARDSGAIEEIAKLGLVLHRPHIDRKQSEGGDSEMWILIDKLNIGRSHQPVVCDWHGPTFSIEPRLSNAGGGDTRQQKEFGDNGDIPF